MANESRSKLECEETFARLSEYLDQELPPEIVDCVSAHIAGCEPCIEFLESLKKSIALCKQDEPPVLFSPLRDEVRQNLRQAYERMVGQRKGSELRLAPIQK
jgi:anti-sigma factor RsiW